MSNLDSRVERSRDSFQDLNTMPTYRLRHQQKRGGSEDDISAMVVDDSDMGLEQVFEKELGLPAIIERRQGANSDTGDRLLVDGTIDPRQYNPIAWCHDTPGLKSPDQVRSFTKYAAGMFQSSLKWPVSSRLMADSEMPRDKRTC